MEYVILEDFEIKNLQHKVNQLMEKNYKPVGGIATANQKDGFIEYIQAMIRDE
ncbi:hypothetical protein MNBD_ALPHA01-1480 [hydrothermal vent metagenome]|uniref:DUF1737 domain-containing protein n=1 Tax=hydrothermal vent metagenome TaxID=652676 RepID=A0A3B0RVY8_9ZZZZ